MSEAPEGATPPPRPPPARGPAKGPAAFRTISEASAELGVPQHVLRFWETRFAFIRPTKRAGGRRFYRPQDLEVLRGVRTLLQDEGYTIKGVQKLHKEGGLKRLLAASGLGEADASRLSVEVEPAEGAQASALAASPPQTPREVPAAPTAPPSEDDGEDDGGIDAETLDLFGAPPAPRASAPGPPSAPPSPAPVVQASPPSASPGRPVLDAASRSRLSEVLDDLESTKAEIDALLRSG